MKTAAKIPRIKDLALLLILAAILFVPRAGQLGRTVFIDETYYLKHGAQFYWAVANHEYAETDLVVHPGVTVNWLGASAFWRLFPAYAEEQDRVDIPDLTFRRMLERNDLSLLTMLVNGRRAVVAFNAVILILAFVLLRRLVSPETAVLAILLAGFDPFYFEHSRFLHVDGILTSLMLVSLLAFMVYLKDAHWGWLVLSGVLGGLAVLTKVSGVVLLAVFGLWGLAAWWGRELLAGAPRKIDGLIALAGRLLVWLGIVLAVIFLLWPAMWVDPIGPLGRIGEFVLDQSSADVISPMFFNGAMNPTGAFDLSYADYYLLTYLWRASPVTLLGLVLLAAGWFLRKRLGKVEIAWEQMGRLAVFVIVYTALMTISTKKFDRYLLPAFLPLDVLAAAGFVYWIRAGLERFLPTAWLRARQGLAALLVVGIAVAQGFLVWQVFPYGLSYYNPLMGGGERAPEVMMVGAGEGLDQAAAYLMEKPDKRNLTIYSFYSNVFGFHFMQQVEDIPWYGEQFYPEVFEADYWVLYQSQRQRGMSGPAWYFVSGYEPEYTVVINGIEYAWIYNLAEIRADWP